MGYAGLDEADIRQGVALLREVVQSFRRGGKSTDAKGRKRQSGTMKISKV
jgi:hypothetical protein